MVYYTGKDKEMTDFHFKADVMTKPGSNGGIFSIPNIRTRRPVDSTDQSNPKGSGQDGQRIHREKHLHPAWTTNGFITKLSEKENVETKVDCKTVVVYNEGKDVKGTRKPKGTIGCKPMTQKHGSGENI